MSYTIPMPPAALPGDLTHCYASVNGIRMHYVDAGHGETIIMLHGFPESWYSWRHQIADFAEDYHVIAPDLRGYNETENRGPHDTDTLQQDVLELMRVLGERQVHLVAHDWGAAIAWLLAMNHPGAVRTLTVCNMPHPALFARGLRNPRQALRSWYIGFFQLPWLPEKALALRDYQLLARIIVRDCKPGTFTRDDVKHFLDAWRQHGLNGGLNWYRAIVRNPRPLPTPVPVITTPTLFIWGEQDFALGKELTLGTDAYVRELETVYLPEASHWVQQDEPGRVNNLLRQHLAGHRQSA